MTILIHKGECLKLVHVLPKFVLAENEKIRIELQVLNESRRVVLETKNLLYYPKLHQLLYE